MSFEIVILDGHVTNPGDVSWGPIEQHGKVTVFDRTAPDQVVTRSRNATIVVINKVKLEAGHFEQLPKLRLVCLLASGKDNVDLEAAAANGIAVKNVVGYGSAAVAQQVFALLFQLTNHVALHNDSVKRGEWTNSQDWCYWKATPVELYGKNFGIYGFGKIGQHVAKIAESLGMRVFVVSNHASAEDYPFYRFVDLEELFVQSDVVSLHAPLNATNQAIINAQLLNKMKPGALLINTARGGLINEGDLRDALLKGPLAGAAVDVLAKEPPEPSHPLLHLHNCIITPHMAWVATETRQRLINMVGENIKAFRRSQRV